jgi:hypothetical protein
MKPTHPVMKALQETGLPWQVETGHGHQKIRLCGRLVGVMSHKERGVTRQTMQNVIAQIRRAAREVRRDT